MKTVKWLFALVIATGLNFQSAGQTASVKEQFAKAKELARQGDTSGASKIYFDMMGVYPDNKDIVREWFILNAKRTPTGEEEGIKQMEELEKNFPNNTAILFWKMFLQAEYNHLEDALKNAEKLTTLQPDSSLNWLGKGQILEGLNRLDEALVAYSKSVELGPGNADTWQNKAGLLAKTNKLDEAIACYDKAIQLAPKVSFFVYNRGCAYSRKGDKANALADLAKAVSLDPRLKSNASGDVDFKNLWEDPDFKKIISQ
jgi:tetratricopeptide (TPR) repeat protein